MSRRCGRGRRRRKGEERAGNVSNSGSSHANFALSWRAGERGRAEGTPQSRSSRHAASQCQTAVVFCRLSAVHCHCQMLFTLSDRATAVPPAAPLTRPPSSLPPSARSSRPKGRVDSRSAGEKSFCAASVVRNAIELFHCSPAGMARVGRDGRRGGRRPSVGRSPPP